MEAPKLTPQRVHVNAKVELFAYVAVLANIAAARPANKKKTLTFKLRLL